MRSLLLFVAGLPLVASLSIPPQSSPTAINKLQGYRSWYLVTPDAIDMAPAVATSCVGPSIWDQAPNPHGPRLFKVFVNSVGKTAILSEGKQPFPIGSMIVKEKFVRPKTNGLWEKAKLAKDAKPELLTAMVKREKGYDSANGDWEYIVLPGDATKKTSVGLEYCAKCHQDRKKQDFVFGDYGSLHHGVGGYRTSPFRTGG